MLDAFLASFLLIFSSELVGATELVIFTLAMRYRAFFPVLAGAFLAHALLDSIAIFVGDYFGSFFPYDLVKKTAGVIFILVGILIIARKKEHHKANIPHAFFATFALVAISELGDKTQIASLLLGATYQAFLPVFLGAVVGLAIALTANVYAGTYLAKKAPAEWIRVVGALVFIAFGAYSYFGI
ncbi:MAG TPA: TMEM165/GDT1 family protein [Candidatus Nanoarchaeia archaeon]|nr:TMEM165/GDT1 family protein [Candidatus Nanoarchaeia archaeon]